MKVLTNVTLHEEFSPNGTQLKYLLSETRLYASARSWERALQVPKAMSEWFTGGLARTAMLKKAAATGELEMLYHGVAVYRWHAVADLLRAFDFSWRQHGYKSRPRNEQQQIQRFHESYERLVAWGYDLQERALTHALQRKADPAAAVSKEMLVSAFKEAVAPRFHDHDHKLRHHDVMIADIKDKMPTMRDENEFISVRQALNEKGLDPEQLPLHPATLETLSGLTGRMLKDQRAERGPSAIARIDSQSKTREVKTYRRRDIYAVLAEILRNRQGGLTID